MKRYFLSYVFTLFLTSVCIVIIAWVISPVVNKIQKNTISPLPQFLTMNVNDQVSTIELFLPRLFGFDGGVKRPDITAKSALLYDITNGQSLFDKNSNTRLPMASLTKIMTAIIALENPKDDNRYIVPKSALVGEDSMGLSENETLSLEELLYGLMLQSGNDAAEVLAYNFHSGRDAFVEAMNKKAQALGLKDTHFTNPTGLQGDGNQYTTAYDLLVITDYVLKNFPTFNKVVATSQYHIPLSLTHKEFYLYNETNLLTTYKGVKGVKTGYTPEAGLCLVTYLDFSNHKILGILLGSENRREEMKNLLDYSLKSLGMMPPEYRPGA